MQRTIFSLLVAAAFHAASAAQAQFIYIDLSYKVILNPAGGKRPSEDMNTSIDSAIEGMNQLLATYYRGYRMRRIDPIRDVGGRDDTTGPSQFYDTDFFADDGDYKKFLIQSNAIYNPGPYAWNEDAVNIYINNGHPGGICSFPKDFFSDDHIVIIGAPYDSNSALQLHEIGHYFNLYHTQGQDCAGCDDCAGPESDSIDDTLADRACWNWGDIARYSFANYPNLSPNQSNQVDNTYFNIMSYHGARTRLTELQLDRWTNAAIFDRDHVTSGRTWFVDRNGTPPPGIPPEWWRNSSLFRWTTVRDGLTYADDGDILLIRPGAYNETMTITKAVTLRATRQGPVSIGTSTSPSL